MSHNGHPTPAPFPAVVPPGTVTITESAPKRCFKCEQPIDALLEFVFGGVILCEPCYRVTVADSEKPAKPKRTRAPKKKHVPIAPAGTVPSGEVAWTAKHWGLTESGLTQLREETVHAQTWFFARAAAMALFGCGPTEVEVKRA